MLQYNILKETIIWKFSSFEILSGQIMTRIIILNLTPCCTAEFHLWFGWQTASIFKAEERWTSIGLNDFLSQMIVISYKRIVYQIVDYETVNWNGFFLRKWGAVIYFLPASDKFKMHFHINCFDAVKTPILWLEQVCIILKLISQEYCVSIWT